MGKDGGSQSSTTVTEPWKEAQPYILDIFQRIGGKPIYETTPGTGGTQTTTTGSGITTTPNITTPATNTSFFSQFPNESNNYNGAGQPGGQQNTTQQPGTTQQQTTTTPKVTGFTGGLLNTPLEYYPGQQVAGLSAETLAAQTALKNFSTDTSFQDTINKAIQGLLAPVTSQGATTYNPVATTAANNYNAVDVQGAQTYKPIETTAANNYNAVDVQGAQTYKPIETTAANVYDAVNVQGPQTYNSVGVAGPNTYNAINAGGAMSYAPVSVAGPTNAVKINLENPDLAIANKQNIDFAGQGYLDKIMSGSLLNPESNPYLQASVEAAIRPLQSQFEKVTTPGIMGNLAMAGRYGSDAMTDLMGQAYSDYTQKVADTTTKMYSDAYNQGLTSTIQGLGIGSDLATSQTGFNVDVEKTNAQNAQDAYNTGAQLQAQGRMAEAQMYFDAAESYKQRELQASLQSQELSATSQENAMSRQLQASLQAQGLTADEAKAYADRLLQSDIASQQLTATSQENAASRQLQAQLQAQGLTADEAKAYADRMLQAGIASQQLTATSQENSASRQLQASLQAQGLNADEAKAYADRLLTAGIASQQLTATSQENSASRQLQAQLQAQGLNADEAKAYADRLLQSGIASQQLTATSTENAANRNLTAQQLTQQGLLNSANVANIGQQNSIAQINAALQAGQISDVQAQKLIDAEIEKFNFQQMAPWTQLQLATGLLSGQGGRTTSTA